jgi:lipoate---protein ligase
VNTDTWRLLDTGLASGARNVALTRALLEARDADEITSTLRFARSVPCVLLACGHAAAHEIDTSECIRLGIEVQRRVSGGSVWYADERQLLWELYLHRRDIGVTDLASLSRRVTHAAAAALAALGPDARLRGRDEIEVDGRTLCATAYASEGHGVLLHGLVNVELDDVRLARVLRLPVRGEAARSGLRARITDLRTLLGRAPDVREVRRNLVEAFESDFDVEIRESDVTLTEQSRQVRAQSEIETRGWIDYVSRVSDEVRISQGEHGLPRGGSLRAAVRYHVLTQTIRQVWFSGDLCLNPARTLPDLEAALRDLPVERLTRRVESFFASHAVSMTLGEPRDFIAAVKLAIGEPLAA